MKRALLLLIVIPVLAFYVNAALAQDLIIFPAKGQSEEQMEKDKFDCYQWAKKQTGFDPMQPQQTAQAPSPQSQGPQGERIKGAARGAVVREWFLVERIALACTIHEDLTGSTSEALPVTRWNRARASKAELRYS